VVTEARPSKSADIAYRQRRYLIMMGVRALLFIVAIVVFVNHGGWITAIPAAGAIIIPYFAVVFANGGREPVGPSRFRPYEPNLPVRHVPTGQDEPGSVTGHGADPGSPGASGVPPHNA
jgi:hypothetical protein